MVSSAHQQPALPDNPIRRRLAQLEAERQAIAGTDPWATPTSDTAPAPSDPLTAPDTSFWKALPEALVFILRPRSLAILALIPIGLGVLMYGWIWLWYSLVGIDSAIPLLLAVVAMLMFTASFMARIIGAGVERSPRMPAPPGTGGFVDEIVKIGGLTCVVYLLAMSPLVLYLFLLAQTGESGLPWWYRLGVALTSTSHGSLIAEILWLCGSAYFPLAVLAFIRSKRFAAIWPATTLRVLLAVPHYYGAVILMHLVLLWAIGEVAEGAQGIVPLWLTLTAVVAELALVCYALGLIAACSPRRLHFLKPAGEH